MNNFGFDEIDKRNRHNFKRAIQAEAAAIFSKMQNVLMLLDDPIFKEESDNYLCEPITIHEKNFNELVEHMKFVMSGEWSNAFNEIFNAIDKTGVEYSIDSDETPMQFFTIILKEGAYHLLVDVYIYPEGEGEMGYYLNTEEDISDIDNELPHLKEKVQSWADVVNIWVSELKRLSTLGLELYA